MQLSGFEDKQAVVSGTLDSGRPAQRGGEPSTAGYVRERAHPDTHPLFGLSLNSTRLSMRKVVTLLELYETDRFYRTVGHWTGLAEAQLDPTRAESSWLASAI